MNPILRTKRNTATYVILMVLFSTVYATIFSMNTGADTTEVVSDAVVFCIIYGMEGIIFMDILRAMPKLSSNKLEWLSISALVIIITSVAIGAETIAAYAASPQHIAQFIATIPQRCMVVILACSFMTLWHLRYIERLIRQQEGLQSATNVNKASNENIIERITLRSGQKTKIIGVEEVEYIKAEGDYVAVVTKEGRWLKECTMKYLEENLPHGTFVRIHRSYIVGVHYITRIERVGKLYQVVLGSGEIIRVSPTGYRLLKEKIKL